MDEAYLTLAAARSAGVVLAMGFDSGPPGANAAELVRMVEGGLSALDGIAAATAGGAQALGRDDLGKIAAGALADLLVLDGDPLADVRVLADPSRICHVILGGRILERDLRPLAGAGDGPSGCAISLAAQQA